MEHNFTFLSKCRSKYTQAGKVYLKSFLMVFSMFLISFTSIAQERTVSGTVKDSKSKITLPGTSIVVKGTSNGTTTDLDGNYQLTVPKGATLVFSFIGYKTKEVEVGSRSVIDVSLREDISQLGEVVVVGYGTQEEEDVTGVVSTVNEKDFNTGQIASPERLITGKIAGVNVSPGNTRSGGASIIIRGQGSINAQQQPLVVIDGVPVDNNGVAGTRNALNFINPADIESVTVLKDASATAIYGSRASAGVIMYTTKKAKEGVTTVVYDGSAVYSAILQEPDFLSTQNFRNAVELKAPQRLGQLGDEDTDWFGAVTRNTISQNHNLSFSGGTNKLNYRASINRMNNNEIIVGDENTVTRLSLLLSGKFLNDNLTVTFNTKNALNQDQYRPNVALTAAAFDPTKPIYVSENEEFGGYYEWAGQGLAPTNPVSVLEQQVNQGENRRSFNSLNLDLKIPYVEGLSFNAVATYDTKDGKNNYFEPFTLRNNNRNGFISNTSTRAETFTYFNYFKYDKSFGESDFDITLGYEFNEQYRENYGYYGENLRDDIKGFNDANEIPQEEIKLVNLSPVRNRLESQFVRANYSLSNKYIATVTLRRDASTRFGPANRVAYFPAGAIAWRIIEEDFFQNLTNVFSNLKIRAGYGETGNQFIGDYLYEKFYYLSTLTASYQFGDQYNQLLRPNAVDPNIKWETLKSTNIGVDFGILNGRISGAVDFYIKDTDDLLFNAPVAAGTNVGDRVITNIGSMRNSGVELSLNNIIYDTQDFTWDLDFNFTYNKNEITKLNTEQDENSAGIQVGGISGDIGRTIQVLKVGEPISSFYAHNQLYDESGNPIPGSPSSSYEDVNGDEIINENDLVVQGVGQSPLLAGLTSNMRYKNFDFSFTLRGKFGGTTYNNLASANGFYNRLTEGDILNNIHVSALETNFNQRHLLSNYYLESSNFVKIDNLSLGYNFSVADAAKFRVYTTVQNMLPLTGYSGLDPEAEIDNNIFPPSTAFILGVNARF